MNSENCDLSSKEKKIISYYLTDEDFANERFAIVELTSILLSKEKSLYELEERTHSNRIRFDNNKIKLYN